MTNVVERSTIDRNVAQITLNRPSAHHALSKQMLDELNQVVRKISIDPSIYCTIITATGEKSFCAGADLKERRGMTDEQVVDAVRYIGETVSNIEKMPMPVIAALNGVAFGGGLELALACDLRLAANHVKMGLTETSLAIIPGAGGTQRLSRLIGIGQAKRLIYTAKPIDAEEAFDLRLVERVVSSDSLLNEAVQWAKTIAQNGPIALRQAKTSINRGMEVDLETGLAIEHLCYKETIPTKDRLEGLVAFKEKRTPQYQGK
ncbi:MAG TPA: enoyl-CoA hydratase [Bacillota bacterium]|nr:enoyl-CoA hydratase [Bacillota bacterium]